MKKIIVFILLIITLTMLSGCKKINYEDDIAVMTEDMKLEDFNYVIDTMDSLYPYWGELEEDGIEKEALQSEYLNKILETKDTIEFLNIVRQYFIDLNLGYGHLSYLGPQAYKSFTEIYKDSKPWKTVLFNKRSKAMYGAMNPDSGAFELAKDSLSADTNSEQSKYNEEELKLELINDGTVMYIKCPSFEWNRAKSEPEKIIEFITKNQNCKNLIIDVRGNGGGSDNYWYDAFAIPNITEDKTYSMYYLYTDETLHNNASKNYMKKRALLKKENTVDNLPAFESLSTNASNFDYFYPASAIIKAENEKALFQGDIYVLTDRENASASATFIGFCKENKFATLVGEASGGDEPYGDPALFALPNSGLIFRFDLFYGLNTDGSSNGVSGVKPDIECDPAKALEVCIEQIYKKSKGK
ncbi:MAG: hypothetical protein K0S47_2143 [Herbinix sp.]|jgi:hypothetical protein|nr:hypothetical protein [Herbinix sp.]